MIWLTTIGARGQPQPAVVWFLWDGASFLVYSFPDAQRLRNIASNPHVALHLDGDGHGGNVVVIHGRATIVPDAPPADAVPDYLEKYINLIKDQLRITPPAFAKLCSVAIRVVPARARAHGINPPILELLKERRSS